MRKIKDIQADIKLVRATARAAVQRLEQEANEVRAATAEALANKRSAALQAKLAREQAKAARAEAKALKEQERVVKAQAVIAKAASRQRTPAQLECTM